MLMGASRRNTYWPGHTGRHRRSVATSTLTPDAETRTPRRSLGEARTIDGARPTPRRRRSDVFTHITPSWFAVVMGTGIVATAAAALPVQVPGRHGFAVAVWLLAVVLLVVVLAATAAHWVLFPHRARGHLADPVIGHFYGAPPMALLTVGAGTLVVGRSVVGLHTALVVDVAMWTVGTALGLATAVVVPAVAHRRGTYAPHTAFGGWLMPVVAPMVSATTGALLLPHLRSGAHREAMLLACYAMFAASLAASAPLVVLVHRRLLRHGVGPAAAVPTVWIVLGPLGQSATAVNVLGAAPGAHEHGRHVFGIVYGVVAIGCALAWLVRAAAVTLRTAADHLPFSLTWWGFTFPVGTCVTGAAALATSTGAAPFAVLAVALFVVLLMAWATVLVRTVHAAPTLLAPSVNQSIGS